MDKQNKRKYDYSLLNLWYQFKHYFQNYTITYATYIHIITMDKQNKRYIRIKIKKAMKQEGHKKLYWINHLLHVSSFYCIQWVIFLMLEPHLLGYNMFFWYAFYRNPDAPAPDGAPPPPGQSDSDEDMSSTSSFSDEDWIANRTLSITL